MTTKQLLRSLLVSALLAGAVSPLPAASEPKKGAPKAKKPAIRVDSTPVADGAKGGLVVTYADVLEPAQKAVVSVYSTKIVKERIAINPFFRQFFGNVVLWGRSEGSTIGRKELWS